MTEKKDWTAEFSEEAKQQMAEDPDIASFVTEHIARMKNVLAEYEAGKFKTLGDALRSIGMEPQEEEDDDDDKGR